jgi:hypothetical protein
MVGQTQESCRFLVTSNVTATSPPSATATWLSALAASMLVGCLHVISELALPLPCCGASLASIPPRYTGSKPWYLPKRFVAERLETLKMSRLLQLRVTPVSHLLICYRHGR